MTTAKKDSAYLKAGYGERIITPPLGINLGGYGFFLDRKAETVLDDLKARALVLQDEQVQVILISCDLLGFSVEFSDTVREELAEKYNIARSNILLACTHTHSGPVTQPLLGLGEMDANYLTKVKEEIVAAVRLAEADCNHAQAFHASQVIEPIGYNRRNGSFADIDPFLKMAIFKRDNRDIYLLSYACHLVTLGRSKEISADWASALIREIENTGNCGIFFQGFCGNIDPVVNINQWGSGTYEDVLFYGKILSHRSLETRKPILPLDETALSAVERRITLPLQVCKKEEIKKDAEAFLQMNKDFPAADKFIKEWKKKAYAMHAEFEEKSFLENVPLQIISIGNLKIAAIPGEVFCQIGLDLQRKWQVLFTFGYANGNIGYIPIQSAYENATDYACYCAPKIYSVFPFSPQVEKILINEIEEMLNLY